MRRPFDSRVAHVAGWLAETGRRLRPDRLQAERFLGILDPDADFFSFRTFSDTPYTRLPGSDPLEDELHGSLGQCWEELGRLNRAGAAVGVTVNETDGRGRGPGNVVRVRALFLDDDRPGGRSETFPVTPHCTVESSPGRYHHYWLVRGLPLADFVPLQRRMADAFRTDRKACALNQSMSLPGFWRRKGARAPWLTTVTNCGGGAPLGGWEIGVPARDRIARAGSVGDASEGR